MNPQNPLNFEQQGQSPNDAHKVPQTQFKRVLDTTNLEKYLRETNPYLFVSELEEKILPDWVLAFRFAFAKNKKTIPFK